MQNPLKLESLFVFAIVLWIGYIGGDARAERRVQYVEGVNYALRTELWPYYSDAEIDSLIRADLKRDITKEK